ncbi:MAG: DUF3667 domain-containing protein [Ferruginibacter sp.]
MRGKFCYNCGEKKPDKSDLSLKKFITTAIDSFTHFDGKFFISLKYLLFFPGKLSTEFLNGRRIKLMKPVQLYLVISIIFFIFPKNLDLFYTPLSNTINQQHQYGLRVKAYAETKAATLKITTDEFEQKFDGHATENGKLFVFLWIPMLSLVLYLLFFKRYRQYVPHLIFSTHYFSFFLVFFLLYSQIVVMPLLKFRENWFVLNSTWVWGIFQFGVYVYLLLAIKQVYRQKWIWVILKSLILFTCLIGMSIYYRQFITWYTLWRM